jgi:m7GpppX diphosphatase
LYEKVVKPYIAAFPPSRTAWVDEVISGRKEAEKVLHRDDSGAFGYMILPDMKWDLETVSSLYLLALATSDGVKSLRDLRRNHVPVLKSIMKEATRVVKDRWGLKEGSLRFFVHYQPSYCEYVGYLLCLPSNATFRSFSCTYSTCELVCGTRYVCRAGASTRRRDRTGAL